MQESTHQPINDAIIAVGTEVQANWPATDERVAFEVYVVWFCYILGGWKALVSTTIPDNKYYEVTFNKDTDEMYVDTYLKVSNKAVPLNREN